MAAVSTPHLTEDVNRLMHIHCLLGQRSQDRSWYIISVAVLATLIISVLIILLRSHLHRVVDPRRANETPPSPQEHETSHPGAPNSGQTSEDPCTKQPAHTMTVFTSYRMAE